MELFLNLFWVFLALPAYWVLRHGTREYRQITRWEALRAGLVLGCMLMLLFPFVSATDDLHAMRPDLEESSSRSLRDGGNDKARVAHASAPVFYNASPLTFGSPDRVVGWVTESSALISVPVLLTTRPGRGPPSLLS